ncbi:MAG: deoxynucleoside kinase [Bacteroidetes bacterium]|jgi:deoxyguanosine kinase|nr:deoxynucleoside kinase [Bacteroidota bacterium]MBT4398966.1 deoxynucleoside kinase [Bacteroidota bacterium]MBT4409757.1 deoxynucleoside kinase [Bacteroidota bacterium]MBT5425669.1 deoxynucleoside kinase [Bacteroidota bacterium]MBT7094144.1 deoxynucleoside kinase [Bacteroidota bacterium]
MNLSEKYPCPYQFVVVEGNIGAGKTSLANRISNDYRAKLILERFADNPFLPMFYKDQDRYAFQVEMSFLADRYNQLKNDLQSKDMFSSFTIADYYFMKSLIFAGNTLASDEYGLYSQIFHIIYQSLPKPDLYVYLHADTNHILNNIRKRGRKFESDISEEYLLSIQKGYFEFFRQQPDLRIVVVDISKTDFVSNDDDYQELISILFSQPYSLGINRVAIER